MARGGHAGAVEMTRGGHSGAGWPFWPNRMDSSGHSGKAKITGGSHVGNATITRSDLAMVSDRGGCFPSLRRQFQISIMLGQQG